MHIVSLLSSSLLFGTLSHAIALPAADSSIHGRHARQGAYHHRDGLASRTPVAKLARQNTNTTIPTADGPEFWLELLAHQGVSPLGPSGYTTFRNVKAFGAVGDGVTDDTDAINEAISSGGRCGQGCFSSTVTPAIIYFPAGTYVVSSTIFDYYNTIIVGNPNALPVLKAASGFKGGSLIDGDPYFTESLNWPSTTVFWRQVRNIVLDTTEVAAGTGISAIHWPTAQATSLQNIVFELSAQDGTQHQGIFCESGSAGFAGDLVFNGGKVGAAVGNQQFTMRNLTFNGVGTAISHSWNWGWTYQGLSINDCEVGIDISTGGTTQGSVGSITVFDSSFMNTPVAIKSAQSESSLPPTAGSIILENISIDNVNVVVEGPSGTVLQGSAASQVIAGWGQGNQYTPDGPTRFAGEITPVSRPAGLLDGDRYFQRSKPQYEGFPASSFSSVRDGGATGDATTDDTNALQTVINSAAASNKVVFLDAGVYKVTKTLTIPANTKIIGEAFPVILSSGEFFNDKSAPKPVIQVGQVGEEGQVELSDFIISTQGAQAGATLIEWNLASLSEPSGLWEVHTRVGGFAGSQQTTAECPKTPGTVITEADENCIVAYMLMHVTPSASNLYIENCWLWVSDHDIDVEKEADGGQITLYSGRGLNIESTKGNIWLSGTSVEHNVLYEYQFVSTKNIYMGQIQTETAYYQPNPNALIPFAPEPSIHDPDFESSCASSTGNCAVGWGLRVVDSQDLHVYGAGLYSFFDNYDATCSAYGGNGGGQNCQNSIFSIEGDSSITVYNLNTLGSKSMVDKDGESLASFSDNIGVFTNNIAHFKTE
ncbi:pectate lyase superfamily protein-domain-containing protein [Aspergillus pseudoustus]|uniref:Pectate lyase superfamily protein-domain-containing protein n=1 Tax=Aspergillus pseudoustus TaxID=1810923 RepID=A0ABR4K3K9_9EURO